VAAPHKSPIVGSFTRLPSLEDWVFLSNHGRALVCIAREPEVRLRDVADRLGITDRSAYGIVNDLTDAGYVIKTKEGRRNRYEIPALPFSLGDKDRLA
jgi:DNA-binding IclR family transcriptional regulator